tara:strand:- start:5054 stop:5476 length:423 start_codon:yes stop_codon:yes gene_type:complete
MNHRQKQNDLPSESAEPSAPVEAAVAVTLAPEPVVAQAPVQKETPQVQETVEAASTMDTWDDVNTLRKLLTKTPQGRTLKLIGYSMSIGAWLGIAVGFVVSIPIIALVSAGYHVQDYVTKRKQQREAIKGLRLVGGSESE